MTYYENEIRPERALLIGVNTGEYDCEASLEELKALAETAGAEVVLLLSQKLESVHPTSYIGTGRLKDLEGICRQQEIDLVIADGELSPVQQRNIEEVSGARVIDRTMLIMDIFALHARSSEGKIQVELAQLRYLLPRLGGKGTSLSRLGGGIGTRGPGESKLETDKRHIRRRIGALEEHLKEIEKRRKAMRERRKKNGVLSVAIVGYTNAGKSTLMNELTEAGVLTENKLFATLDPTARALKLPSGTEVMLVDTVGLVRRLPHKLVEAFHSTLEEAKEADLILNVCDASDPACAEHLQVTRDLLKDLNAGNTPCITVMNKCDLAPQWYDMPSIGKSVAISALHGDGIEALLKEMEAALMGTKTRATLLIPFQNGNVLAEIRKNGQVLSEEYEAEGIKTEIIIDAAYLNKYKDFLL